MKRTPRIFQVALILMATVLVSACGDDAQKRYDRATEALKDAREHRQEAQVAVKDKENELNELQEKLDKAEKRLGNAREQLREAQAAVSESVTDEVLFRTLQKKMLDEDDFGDSAIAVGVSDRVVTLTGTVPDKAAHKKALKTAKDQSGVEEVVDFLEIENKAAKKANPAPSGE